jgi:hypothetical protein
MEGEAERVLMVMAGRVLFETFGFPVYITAQQIARPRAESSGAMPHQFASDDT